MRLFLYFTAVYSKNFLVVLHRTFGVALHWAVVLRAPFCGFDHFGCAELRSVFSSSAFLPCIHCVHIAFDKYWDFFCVFFKLTVRFSLICTSSLPLYLIQTRSCRVSYSRVSTTRFVVGQRQYAFYCARVLSHAGLHGQEICGLAQDARQGAAQQKDGSRGENERLTHQTALQVAFSCQSKCEFDCAS